MWPVVSAAIVAIWAVFFWLSRPLARAGDRFEVAVLKPLAMSYVVLSLEAVLNRWWVMGGLFAVSWIVTSAMGAARHPKMDYSGLAQGTEHSMLKGPPEEPESAETFQVAQLLMPSSWMVGALLCAGLWSHARVPWYFAIPAGFAGALLFAISATFLMLRRPS